MTDTNSTPNLREHFTRLAEHYVPAVDISDDGNTPLTVDQIGNCAERFLEFWGEIRDVPVEAPQYFEYLNAAGHQAWGDLLDADTDAETLAAGLAYTAAQAAALQRELARLDEHGVAFLRALHATEKENAVTSDQFAHPVDEPCPNGCPTRLAEIAAYITECHGAGIAVTADTVREALATPAEQRDDIQRQIAEIEATWA